MSGSNIPKTDNLQSRLWSGIALGFFVAILVFLLFHFLGNRSNVGMEPRSLFVWIGRQWLSAKGDFSHGWIMPIISLGVVWMKRKELFSIPRKTSFAGIFLLLSFLLLHWVALRAQQPRVSLVALVGVIWSIPLYLYGFAVARHLLFPCGYLLLCFTSYLMVSLAFPLRLLASSMSATVLNGIGISAVRNGTAIYSSAGGGFNFDVADPCSGLRSLVVMTALAAPLAYFTQKGLIKQWLLFAFSLPLAIFANMIRIVTIAVVAQFFGQDLAISVYHDYSGYILFGVAALLLTGAGSLLNINYSRMLKEWKSRELPHT